jgi:hypothetical protein
MIAHLKSEEKHYDDVEVEIFFKKLGYTVTWDQEWWFDSWFDSWGDISDKDGLICRIDGRTPLNAIVEDICQWHLGKPSTSSHNWTCRGPDTPRLNTLFKRVYDYTKLGIEPDGQLTFAL